MNRRIIVAGGNGFFGSAAVERLKTDKFSPVCASRSGEFKLDVENRGSIRAVLKPGDIVIDCVGPFQDRTMALVECAAEIGFDVIDISDSVAYCEKVLSKKVTNIRILTACSSISAIPATFITLSEIKNPVRISTFLAPETKYASRPGAGTSLLRSIGRKIKTFSNGKFENRYGWRKIKRFRAPSPLGTLECRQFETADAATLPPVWPTLRDIDFWVDSRIPALNRFFEWSDKFGCTKFLESSTLQKLFLPVIRILGPKGGAICVEIEGDGTIKRFSVTAGHKGYYTPIIPAVIAAENIAKDKFSERGVVPADKQVNPGELLAYLGRIGVKYSLL